MTNFLGDGLPFNPETPAHRLKNQLTDLFFDEDWFVGAGVRAIGGRQGAFLMVDQLALSPKLIYAGFFRVLGGAFPALLSEDTLPEAIYLSDDDIFYHHVPVNDNAPLLAIEMTLGEASPTTAPTAAYVTEGGQRIRLHGQESSGTLATVVNHHNGPMLLTNQHVLAAANQGDPVEVEIGGVWHVVGTYECGSLASIRLGASMFTVDAALARLASAGTNVGRVVGFSNRVATAGPCRQGTPVQKMGARTARTTGDIESVEFNVKIGGVRFENQILVRSGTPFQEPGDSGSLLLTDAPSPSAVGLLHGHVVRNGIGMAHLAIASPWQAVAASLCITL